MCDVRRRETTLSTRGDAARENCQRRLETFLRSFHPGISKQTRFRASNSLLEQRRRSKTQCTEDLSQPSRSRLLATREEPCQVPEPRSSYVSFRICDVILIRPAGDNVCL
ncbi:PREDICTED: uncharacterized protein LOC108773572 [Cyphomyrmex costatus]|uniref:uncharacterized protein LOC108773572 n=1 Tax=Cyphomyrmex costatus TaxID=456900 RepID=UPI0008523847|nr:PREDICTED: uncharacterized protein LOC108773572 [Cyphomyrmex costatus]